MSVQANRAGLPISLHMSSTPSMLEWTPDLKRRVAALHAGIWFLAGLFWCSGAWLGGGYRIELMEALIVSAIPALPIRCLSIWLATVWTRRAIDRGTPDSFRHFACADIVATMALGLVAMPVILRAYFVFAGVAWTMLFPMVPAITAFFMKREGVLGSTAVAAPQFIYGAEPAANDSVAA